MKEVKYRCDLCREYNESSNLLGFEFEYGGKSLVIKSPPEVERHFCKGCAIAMQSLLKSVESQHKIDALLKR